MNISRGMYHYIQAVLNWIYPPICLTCTQSVDSKQFVCDLCWSSIPKIEKIDLNTLWLVRENKDKIYFEDFYSCFYFDNKIQQIIHALKYEKITRLAGEIVDKILPDILGNKKITTCDLIVPIPLHKKRLKSRGYNQSAILAKELSKYFKIPFVEHVIQRKKNTISQTKLDAKDRQENMRHAFIVKDKKTITGAKILLLDDLITTGVTANECAKVLKEGGVKEIIVFTIARPV